jgi:hypothetical protein
VAEIANPKAQSPLEENEGHGKGNDGKKEITQELIGANEAGDRAGKDAEEQEEEDRRETKLPGQPLGNDAEKDDTGQGEQDPVGQAVGTSSDSTCTSSIPLRSMSSWTWSSLYGFPKHTRPIPVLISTLRQWMHGLWVI